MKMTARLRWFCAVLIVSSTALSIALGCGDDATPDEVVDEDSTIVGGTCSTHSDCEERCISDGFPGGMCTLTCESHSDCPEESSCVDIQGGVCLMDCETDGDCPGGYACDDEDGYGPRGGEVDVCLEA